MDVVHDNHLIGGYDGEVHTQGEQSVLTAGILGNALETNRISTYVNYGKHDE